MSHVFANTHTLSHTHTHTHTHKQTHTPHRETGIGETENVCNM